MKGKSEKMRRIICLMSVLFLISATGCASGKIHERSYLRAAAVMKGADCGLTMSFYDEDEAVSAFGENMDLARSNAELKNGKPVFTGYTELILVDDMDCHEYLEHMLNDWKVSPSCIVAYCENGKELIEKSSAEQLAGIVRQAVRKGIAPECDIVTVLGRLCNGHSAEVAELYTDGTAGSRVIG